MHYFNTNHTSRSTYPRKKFLLNINVRLIIRNRLPRAQSTRVCVRRDAGSTYTPALDGTVRVVRAKDSSRFWKDLSCSAGNVSLLCIIAKHFTGNVVICYHKLQHTSLHTPTHLHSSHRNISPTLRTTTPTP